MNIKIYKYFWFRKNQEIVNSNKNRLASTTLCGLLLLLATPSCKKFVDIDSPKTQIITAEIFKNDATATSAITGIYSRMMNSSGFAGGRDFSITILSGLPIDSFDRC